MKSVLIEKTIYLVQGHNIKSKGTIVYASNKFVAYCDVHKDSIVKCKIDRATFNYLLSEDRIRVKKINNRSSLINNEIINYKIKEYKLVETI